MKSLRNIFVTSFFISTNNYQINRQNMLLKVLNVHLSMHERFKMFPPCIFIQGVTYKTDQKPLKYTVFDIQGAKVSFKCNGVLS